MAERHPIYSDVEWLSNQREITKSTLNDGIHSVQTIRSQVESNLIATPKHFDKLIEMVGQCTTNLNRFDEALAEMKQGTYGYCKLCNASIELSTIVRNPLAQVCKCCRSSSHELEATLGLESKD